MLFPISYMYMTCVVCVHPIVGPYMYMFTLCVMVLTVDLCDAVLTKSLALCTPGEGGKVREHKTSFHAIARVVRSEGVLGLYNGYVWCLHNVHSVSVPAFVSTII